MQTLSFGGLIVCLTLIIGLYLLVKLAKLESNFWETQQKRKIAVTVKSKVK